MNNFSRFIIISISLLLSLSISLLLFSCDFGGGNDDKSNQEYVVYDIDIFGVWKLDMECIGTDCDNSPFTVSFDLDSEPGDETSFTFLIYLYFKTGGEVTPYMKILSLEDPHSVFYWNVGDIFYCPSDTQSFIIDGNSITFSYFGSASCILKGNILEINYSSGFSDTLTKVEISDIEGAYMDCG